MNKELELKNANIIAITGPSGVGKNTLGNMLKKNFNFTVPRHCTTRKRRRDDEENFYRYLSHEDYSNLLYEEKFLFSSGDGPEVLKEYGNFYGVLKDDILDALFISNHVILYVSYKDLEALEKLKKDGYNIKIVALKFSDVKKGVLSRIANNKFRKHSKSDIERRVESALELEEAYKDILEKCATSIIYTDKLNKKKMFKKACKDLSLDV